MGGYDPSPLPTAAYSVVMLLMEAFLNSPHLLLFARLTLGGVFVLSAIAKWRDQDAAGTTRAWMPAALATAGRRLLPPVEALVGGLLIAGLATRPAALGAGVLLLLFSAVVFADLRQGQGLPCGCFGRITQEPASPATLVRNGVLLALAGLLAWQPSPYLALDGLLAAPAPAGLPPAVDAIPIGFLAVLAIVGVVLGQALLSTVRGFLRAF